MCLYNDYKTAQKVAAEKLKKFRLSLDEANNAQVSSEVKNIGRDEKSSTKLHKKDGYKITDKNSLKRIEAAKTRRASAINKAPKKKEIVGTISDSTLTKWMPKTLKRDCKKTGRKKGDVTWTAKGVLNK